MQPLSPVEAIGPALSRTRAVLFQPYRSGRSWKLAFCAYIALCGSLFLPFPFLPLFISGHRGAGLSFLWVMWIASLAFSAVMFAFYYLGSRMQFVLFDFVLSPCPRIAPLWRRHGARTWRWIGLKLAITLPISVAVILPLYPIIKRLITLFPALQAPQQPPDPRLIAAFFSLYAVLLVAMFLLFLVASILSDFLLPSLALEEISASGALRRFGNLCRREPLTLIGYVAMRILLAIVGILFQYVATLIATLLIGLILGILAFAGWFTLHASAPRLLLIIGGVALYLVFVACLFYIQLGTFGTLVIFFRAYSLYFLGGRYPLLAELLEPVLPISTPPPPLLAPHPEP